VRVLLTGATGVIGRLVVPDLVARGHHVTALGRTPESRAALSAMGADAIVFDIFDVRAATEAMAGHDTVINLATHIPGSAIRMLLPWSWRENDRIRRDASAALVDAALAAGVSRFVQESFAPVYEDAGDRWIDERWPTRPAPYNRTVLAAEANARRVTSAGGTGVVLRFAGFYGPDPFLRDMVDVVRRGRAPLPGDGDAYWSSVSHADAATATVASLDLPAGIYNVCDDEPLTRRAWADTLADAAGLPHPKLMPAWMLGLGGKSMALLARSQRMSNARLKAATGWQPRWPSAREGLKAAVAEIA
jgi:nucleoside-diphosphate-sugar epimerase